MENKNNLESKVDSTVKGDVSIIEEETEDTTVSEEETEENEDTTVAQEIKVVDKDPLGVKILGGFFVFRNNPNESEPVSELSDPGSSTGKEFSQKGEVIGIVLIKQYGIRKFMGYSPIDPATFKLDAFITNFSNTNMNNAYDNNKKNVFDMDTMDHLINKMIIQPVDQK